VREGARPQETGPRTNETSTMVADLARRFAVIEDQRETLVARVAALSAVERRRRPRPGEWSPLEVIHHLALAEEQTVGQLDAARTMVAASGARSRATRSPLVPLLVAVMRAGLRLPTPPSMEPPTNSSETDAEGFSSEASLERFAERWRAARQTLQARLEAITSHAPGEPVAQHPIFGPLDARQVLDLAEAHGRYHERQLSRVCRAVREARVNPR
jgi:hypothetical protein